MSWTALVVLSAGAYAFKLTGVVAGERFADRLAPVTALLPAALFSALVVTMAVADGPFLVVDARLVGVAAGALAETKLLGGQAVIVIAEEVETAFTYGQNWPLGAALAMVLIVIVGGIAIWGIGRADLDRMMGRR